MLSIIIPIYNIEKYLNKCLDSIFSQDLHNVEVILVDDGSTDSCPDICDKYVEKYNNSKVIHKENGGLMSARQAGFLSSKGDYILFVDGDDWVHENLIERIDAKLHNNNFDLLAFDFFFANGEVFEKSIQIFNKTVYSKEEIKTELIPKMIFNNEYYKFGIYPCCWSKVFKRNLLEANLLSVDPKIKIGEDTAFTYPSILDAESICYINEPLYFYRNNDESLMNKYDSQMYSTILMPYLYLKSLNEEKIEAQTPYYLLFLLSILIRNEASRVNNNIKNSIINIKDLLSDKVLDDLNRINIELLPRKKRVLLYILKNKKFGLLKMYLLILRRV